MVGSRRTNHHVALIQDWLTVQDLGIWNHGGWGNRKYSHYHMLRTGNKGEQEQKPEGSSSIQKELFVQRILDFPRRFSFFLPF